VAAAAVVTVGGLVSTGIAGGPGAPSASSTRNPSTVTATGHPQRVLSPEELGYGFRSIAPTFDPPAAGVGPMGSCRYSTLPAAEDSGQLTMSGYRRPAGGEVTEWVVGYRPGSAIAGIRDEITQRVANECRASYAMIDGALGVGEASVLIQDRSGAIPLAGPYEVFLAAYDFLIWLRVDVDLPGMDGADYARHLAGLAAHRLGCAVTGQPVTTC
jgi:hypothetical protein